MIFKVTQRLIQLQLTRKRGLPILPHLHAVSQKPLEDYTEQEIHDATLEVLENLESQRVLCEELYGKTSQWYYDIWLRTVEVLGIQKDWYNVLNSYRTLIGLGEEAESFFGKYQSFEVLGYIQ